MKDPMISHLPEGALLGLLDGDPSAASETAHAHLAGCIACQARLKELRRRAERISTLIGEIEFPEDRLAAATPRPLRYERSRPPARVWTPLRAAAAIALLFAPIVLVSPVGAHMLGWITESWGGLVQEEPSMPTATLSENRSGRIWFEPSGAELQVRVEKQQRSGALRIEPGIGSEISMERIGAGTEMPVVSESTLRIQNEARSSASYRIILPPAIERLQIQIGSGQTRTFTREEIGSGVVVELDEAA